MPELSRRTFLKCAGISLLSGAAATLPSLLTPFPASSVHGRALSAVPVYGAPFANAAVQSHLWPDSIVPISDSLNGWYTLNNGYAKREYLQPVLLSTDKAVLPEQPFYAEVTGSLAVVRQWCAADAPLVARIGHGGVAYVVDRLADDHGDWFAVADDDEFLGWSQAAPWQAVTADERSLEATKIVVDARTMQLQVIEQNRTVLQSPISFSAAMLSGTYSIQQRKRSVKSLTAAASEGCGTPWQMEFEGYSLAGVYWHNRFGSQTPTDGPSVQVTPPVARWLYHHIPAGTPITIR